MTLTEFKLLALPFGEYGPELFGGLLQAPVAACGRQGSVFSAA